MNFGRTVRQQRWELPSSVKFWVTTYDAEENLVCRTVNSLGNLHGKGRKRYSLRGSPLGLRGCCVFLETAETTELQKI
jgi:hypothetical protein